MKLFDGINKYTYQTIFGKVQLVKSEHGIIYKLHDEVNVDNLRLVASGRLWQMRFDNRVLALKKLIEYEKRAVMTLYEIMNTELGYK